MQAKIFALSLKLIHRVEMFNGNCGKNLPMTNREKSQFKESPWARLFGSNANVCILKPGSNKIDKCGIIYMKKFIGSGSVNKAQIVYELERGESILRSIHRKSLSNWNVLAEWNKEIDYHTSYSSLNISGIVKLFEVFLINSSKGQPSHRSMLLEKCDGNLNDLMNGNLSLKMQKSIVSQILATLALLHEGGELPNVHGDLKPGNIFFIRNGDEIIVKIGDLGAVGIASAGLGCTATPEYATPYGWCVGHIGVECSKKQDMFGLGMIAMELRYGRFFLGKLTNEYRIKLMNDNSPLKQYYNLLIAGKIDQNKLKEELCKIYPHTAAYINEILDEENPARPINEIFIELYRIIIEKEFLDKWRTGVEEFINFLKTNPDPYNQLILNLINPDEGARWTASQALSYLGSLPE